MKSYRDNGSGGGGGGGFGARSRTVYDDVFGGPPKFGAPTLPPRHEDYTEIFQGFHASRGSSIPVLDLPPASDGSGDVWFDVEASKLDYSEVFGGFSGLDFAVSYEELFGGSKVADNDSSDEVWTPAQSELLSDESDPYVSLEMDQRLSNADPEHSFDTTKQFNLSQNKASSNAETDIPNGMKNDSQFHDLHGSTVVGNQTLPSKIGNEKLSSEGKSDCCVNKDFGGVTEGKRLKKALSQPLASGFDTERYESDLSHLVGSHKTELARNNPLFSVSDISLKTQPSQLPPPSRPPPTLASKKGDVGGFNSTLKTSKSYAFERKTGGSSPPYFDVEIDASSSAAVSAAAMKDAMEQAQVKLRSAKELRDRKEGSRSKLRMENNIKDNEGRVNKDCEIPNGFDGGRIKGSHERGSTRTTHDVREERQKMKETIKAVTGASEGEKNIGEVGNFVKRKAEKEYIYQGLDETVGAVTSREAIQYSETVVRKQVKDAARVFKQNSKAALETFEQQEDGKNVQIREVHGLEENKERRETLKKSHREEKHIKKSIAAQKACESSEREQSFLVSRGHEEIKTPSVADETESYESLIEIQLKGNDMETGRKLVGVNEKVETENQLKNDCDTKGYYMGSAQDFVWEQYELGPQEAIEEEYERRLEETLEQDAKEIQQPGPEIEVNKNEEENDHGGGENEIIVEDPRQWEENEKRFEKASEQEESDNMSETVLKQDENKKEKISEHNEKVLHDVLMLEKGNEKAEEALEQDEKMKKRDIACEREDNEQSLNDASENEAIEKNHEMDCNSDEDRKLQDGKEREGSEKREEVVFGKDGLDNKAEFVKWEGDEKPGNTNEEDRASTQEDSEASDGAYQVDDNEILQATRDIQHDIPSEKIEATPETSSCMKNEKPWSNKYNEKVVGGAAELINELGEESFCSSGLNQNGLQLGKDEARVSDATNSNGNAGKSYGVNVIGPPRMENEKPSSEMTSGLENSNNFTHDQGGKRTNFKGSQSGFDLDGRTNTSTSSQVVRKWVESGGRSLPDQVDPSRNTNNTIPKVVSRSMERMDESRNKTLLEEREKEEKLRRERELENDRIRKLEEERERQIEREKDRMAVDRATLEARERAFAETRERAERAAVERATAEFRQRALAEARERLERACAEARERSLADKASEARLRVERAAVEKATAEARERAERSVPEKLSASRSTTTRQNSLSSDMPDSQFHNLGPYGGLRYSHTAAHNGGEGESPQRCKARLERHQRTADRAAKALAEKNMRDLIAQKEQAERNRLAEVLDAEIKRWSSGKQGNLRALLSTLQYILGPDSGWQPVPLTEVITTAAVKKAYRKATLCVHPDKLQQRGASIQQKYICEKVFDLLKEAWNKFNSEER